MTVQRSDGIHVDTSDLGELSQLALVASDASYAGKFALLIENGKLAPFDDTPQYLGPTGTHPRPPFGFGFQIAYGKYVVAQVFEVKGDETGFKAVAYRDDLTNDVVIAFAGTDGSDLTDWWGNAFHYGWNQWGGVGGRELRTFLDLLPAGTRVHFVGQSLGGALAQYAAYQYVLENLQVPEFSKKNVSLVTFNALGGVAALRQNTRFDPNLLAGLGNAVHYVVQNDLVHRLGDGHVGGVVKQFNWVNRDAPPNTVFNRLDTVDAHRIESAFYTYLNPAKNFFAEAVPLDRGYSLNIPTFQKLLSRFGNLEQKTQVGGSLEAFFQILAGVIRGGATAPEAEVKAFMRAAITAYRDSGRIPPAQAELLFDTNWSNVFRAVGASEPTDTLNTYRGAIVMAYLAAVLGATSEYVRNAAEKEFGEVDPVLVSPDDLYFLAHRAEILAETSKSGSPLAQSYVDKEELAKRMASGEGWFTSTSSYLLSAASSAGLGVVTAVTFAVEATSQAYQAGRASLIKLGADLAELDRRFSAAVMDLARAIGNSVSDYLKHVGSVATIGSQAEYEGAKAIADAFLQAISNSRVESSIPFEGAALKEILESQRLVKLALTNAVVVPGIGTNPFNTPLFNPDALPAATVAIPEGGAKFFTVYLPYDAGPGGQSISLTAIGPNSHQLRLNTGEEVPNVNGTFTVSVPEGARQLVLAFSEVGDIDADATLEINAQLVDTLGNPTHNEHLELTLTLEGEAEADIAEAPGQTTRTIVGDLRAIDGDPGTPEFDPVYDDLGNLLTTDEPFPGPDKLKDSGGNDLILAGESVDVVDAFRGGDDAIYGGPGDDELIAGPGNDWVEGEADQDVMYGDAGDDRLIGGAGIDFLSGDVSRNYVLTRGFVPDPSTQLAGEDVLEGGSSTMDMLIGGGGRDSLYANAKIDTEQAIEEGETASPSGARGDWLAGGAGNDILIGADDNEALFGGSGGDLIVAGAGDDHVNADRSYISEFFDWLITEEVSTVGNETIYTYNYGVVFSDGDTGEAGGDRIYTGAGADIVDAGGGDDFVDAGSGNDKVWGHAGGDVIFGEGGDDLLQGDNSASVLAAEQHGSDFIDGGAGNDRILGDGGNDALYGGDGDDFLQGDTVGIVGGNDYLNGEAGNDTLSGNGGADVLVGGAGDDELFGDSDDTPLAEQGADELVGGEGNDRLQGYGGDDMLDGGSGLDELFGGAGADRLIGGDGNDRLFGEDGTDVSAGGNDTILGGLGDDEIRGEGGNDTIDGGGGADVVGGDEGDDAIYGGLGNDQLAGGEGNDILRGEGGDDILAGDAGGDDIDGGAGNDQVDAGEGIDRVAGGDGDDTLLGGAGADELLGDEGNDILLGGDDADLLDGGAGNDHLQGGAGVDTYVWDFGSGEDGVADDLNNLVRFGPGITRDFLSLGIGSLLIRVGGENALHIEGFDAQNPYASIGISELQFTDFDGNVVDTMTWNELLDLGFDLVGTPDPDFISGTEAADRIYGLEDIDVLLGRGGDDAIYGGEGDDTISGDDGNDTLYGEGGDDNIGGGAGNDIVAGDAGDDLVNLGDGNDTADGGEGDDLVEGGAGDDLIGGGAGDDELAGSEGADTLDGGTGNDVLYGDAGDDVLVGGEANDFLRGGEGADVLAGGLGDDSYFLDDGLDAYTENAGEGDDAIVTTFDFVLGENFENLELAGGSAAVTGTGSAVDNFIAGNENDNFLHGLEGDDNLDGGAGNDVLDGGTGGDVMFGGYGDDLFIVDSEDDAVGEEYDLYHREVVVDDFGNVVSYGFLEASGGADTVEASVSFALDQWTEALVLTGGDAIDGTGNVAWNTIKGNDADNALYAYRLNGEADTYPTIGIIVQQFSEPRNAAEEMLQDKANVAIYRAEFPWFIPLQVDLYAGAGDELYGMGGNDRLYGGLDSDYLVGGDGDDLLYGFAGSDTMAGGAGDDTYVVSGAYSFRFNYVGGEYVSYEDEGTDTLFEAEGEGIDTVYAEVDFALPDNFENLTLVFDTRDFDPDVQMSRLRSSHIGARVGEGNALDNVITANDGGNALYGYEGDDTLVGGAGHDYLAGGEGADTMRGGAGNDAYDVDSAGDQVIEMAGGGHDEVVAEIDYTLTDNVEDLYLIGQTYTENLSGTGNELDNYIEGNDGNNVLLGLAGNDFLYGGGGDDVMDGGAGDDTYYVDSELDVTTEAAGEGHDTVYSSVSHALGEALEDLYLTEFDGIWGEGNALANLIVGNEGGNYIAGFEGDDVLRGEGGLDQLEGGEGNDFLDGGEGDDTMAGGLGDDAYYVDRDFDVVLELEAEGIDTVYESVWYYTIGENVENAAMLGDFQDQGEVPGYSIQGNALDNEITGNDNENWLSGNEGNDTIDGRARDDYLGGGLGDDTLYGGDDAIRHELLYMDSFGNIYWWDYGGLKPVGSGVSELASNSDDLDGGEGNDSLDGGSGDDWLYGDQGNDYLYGGDDGLVADDAEGGGGGEEEGGGGVGQTDDGREFLRNEDDLRGGAGDDVLDGGSDDDELYGEDGNDTLLGGADGPLNRSNDDYLNGGAGIDFMAGGTGDDTYVVDGFFTETTDIEVYDDCGELVPGAVTRVWTTDTVLEVADDGYDRVWSFADYTLPEQVEELTLWWSASDARIGRGNAGDNYLYGNLYDNRLEGGAGDDTIYGGAGDDVLDGGADNDWLSGGYGNNTYLFGAGYGHDIVVSIGDGLDRVHLAHGVAPGDVMLTRQGDDVVVALGDSDRMVLQDWFAQPTIRVREILFCDDPAWDEATIAALANGRVDPVDLDNDYAGVEEDSSQPATGNVLDNDSSVDSTLTVVNPGVFVGSYGTLQLSADGSFSYALDNASPYVQWLAVNETGYESFDYIAADALGGYGEATLTIEIAGTNDAPVLDSGADVGLLEDAGALQRFADGQLLENGGFESGSDGWSWEGNEEFRGLNSLPSEGSMAAFFGAVGTPTLLSQAVETMAGERYLLEFMLMGGTGAGAEVQVTWNGETLLTVSDTAQEFGYRPYQVVLDGIDGASLLELALRNNAGFWHLDDVRLGLLQEFESVSEFQEADGAITFTDVDYSDWHVLSVQPQGGDYLGEFDAYIAWDSAYTGDGQVEWSFSVANEDLQFLAEGETREQVYDLTLADPFGGTDTKSVTVTLRGVNDAPEAENDWIALSEDDVLAVSGNALDNDFDIDLADVLSVAKPGSFAGIYGTLELAADGSYTYTLHKDAAVVQALNAGELVEEVFEYAVTDGLASNLPQLFVEIAGANDAPVALDDAAEVQEDGVLVDAGNVLDNDSDADAGSTIVVTNPGVYAGAYGSLTLGADGGYVYTLDNALAQPLGAGQEIEEVFAYEVTDGIEPASAALTVTVVGANDAPTADDLAATVGEDGPGVTLTPVYADADAGSVQSLAVGAYSNAGFEQGGFAGWQLTDAALGEVLSGGAPLDSRYASLRSGAGQDAYTVLSRQFTLAAGESLSGLAEFVAGDALPYDDDGYVSVRLLGGASTLLFSASVASTGDYGTIGWTPFEFVAPEAGTYVLEAGVRNAQDNSVDSRLNLDGVDQFGPAAGVTLNADGTIGYDPGGRFEWLAEGETATEAFSLIVTDDQGAQALASATVQIVGANDAPEIGDGDTSASVLEDNALPGSAELGAQGALAFSDVDLSDVHQVQLGTLDSGYLGQFGAQLAVDTTGDGEGSMQWSFSIANAGLDALGEGETLVQSYEVLVEDTFGGSAERVVTIALAGVNDGPLAGDDAAAVQEDGALVASGDVLANDSDADANDTLSVADHGPRAGAWGTLQLFADGGYRYDLDNAAAQSLGAGEIVQEVFGYAATDGRAFAPASLVITITGVNDAPVTVDDAASVVEDLVLSASGNVLANDSDVDDSTTLTVANAGLYGSLTLAEDGAYTYTLDNASAAVQGLRGGEEVFDQFEYLASDGLASIPGTLTVSVLGVNDAPVLAVPIADQDAAAGTPFAFTFAADAFTDIDIGDSLAYSASLADGAALPAWLSFDAGTRTFSGNPPGGTGGGTGDDCGCGTDGGSAPETLQLRVTAMDTAGESASDDFVLNIAGGSSGDLIVPIVGTNGDDVLSGTSGDDVIDGRKGYDRMSGGAGDDVYFVDLTCTRDGHKGNEGLGNGEDPPPPGHDSNWNDGPGTSPGHPGSKGGQHGGGGRGDDRCRVDLVIEGAVAGYDTVYSSASYTLPANVEELHLIGREDLVGRGNALANMLIGNSGDNRLYGMAGNDLLLDDAGHDLLDGGDGDDVLDGGRGNDALAGGKGNDLFVHALGGGHDVVRESGGQDAIRFGAGIAAADVTAWRHGDSLVLSLAGGAESVTVKDWFSHSSKRVEQVQFADGTAWNEDEIRARVMRAGAGGAGICYTEPVPHGYGNGGEDRQDDQHDDGDGDHGNGDGLYDAIAARLRQSPDYDFTALAVYLQREGGGGYGAMTPEQIARRWVQVQNCVGSLAQSDGDWGGGHGGDGHHGGYGSDDDHWRGGWGYSGSTGQSNGCGGMGTFSGLGEGFQKL